MMWFCRGLFSEIVKARARYFQRAIELNRTTRGLGFLGLSERVPEFRNAAAIRYATARFRFERCLSEVYADAILSPTYSSQLELNVSESTQQPKD